MKLFLTLIPTAFAIWSSSNGNIQNDGIPIAIRGITWYGFDSTSLVPEGLFKHNIDYYLDLLAYNNFNVIQIPFSSTWITDNIDFFPSRTFFSADSSLENKTSIEILDVIFSKAQERGIAIVLNHFDSNLTNYINVMDTILDRYSDNANFMGINILNNPDFNYSEWIEFIESTIHHLDLVHPHSFLYFINGIQYGYDWSNALSNPIDILNSDRLVYSINSYAPSIYTTSDTKKYDWYDNFGFLNDGNHSLIIGSWGARFNIPTDVAWSLTFTTFLVSSNIRNNIYWSFGSLPGIRKGLLNDDWSNLNPMILEALITLQPNPTKIIF